MQPLENEVYHLMVNDKPNVLTELVYDQTLYIRGGGKGWWMGRGSSERFLKWGGGGGGN